MFSLTTKLLSASKNGEKSSSRLCLFDEAWNSRERDGICADNLFCLLSLLRNERIFIVIFFFCVLLMFSFHFAKQFPFKATSEEKERSLCNSLFLCCHDLVEQQVKELH